MRRLSLLIAVALFLALGASAQAADHRSAPTVRQAEHAISRSWASFGSVIFLHCKRGRTTTTCKDIIMVGAYINGVYSQAPMVGYDTALWHGNRIIATSTGSATLTITSSS